MKEKQSVNLPLGSLLLVGIIALGGVLVWKLYLTPKEPEKFTDQFRPPTLPDEPIKVNPGPIQIPETNPTPQDHLPPLPGKALPVLKSISDIFAQTTDPKTAFKSSTLKRGGTSKFEVILQPEWKEASSADFEATFLFGDEVILGIKSRPLPAGNNPHLVHAGATLDSILGGYKDLRLRVQDTLEIAGESWQVFELGSAQASHLGLFTYAGPKGCFTLTVAAQNRSFELRRNEWSRVIQSFRFPPK